MNPFVRIEIKNPCWPFLWLKFVKGFDPRHCCAKSLKGRFWDGIPWIKHQAGENIEGSLEFEEPAAYLCGVNRKGYDANLHLPMRKNPRSRWTLDLPDIQVYAEGLQRLPPILPLPPEIAKLVTPQQAACRNFRWGYATWPESLQPTPLP